MNIENIITSLCEKFSVTVAQLSSAVISYHKVFTGVTAIISFSLCLIFGFVTYLAYKKYKTQDSRSYYFDDTWISACVIALIICAVSFFVFVFALANFCIWSLAPEGAFVDYLVGLVN